MRFKAYVGESRELRKDVEAFEADVRRMLSAVSGRSLGKLSDSKGDKRYKVEFEATLRHGVFLETAKATAYSNDADAMAEIADAVQTSCRPNDLAQTTAVRFYSADGRSVYGALIGFADETEWRKLNGFLKNGKAEFDFSDPLPIED